MSVQSQRNISGNRKVSTLMARQHGRSPASTKVPLAVSVVPAAIRRASFLPRGVQHQILLKNRWFVRGRRVNDEEFIGQKEAGRESTTRAGERRRRGGGGLAERFQVYRFSCPSRLRRLSSQLSIYCWSLSEPVLANLRGHYARKT